MRRLGQSLAIAGVLLLFNPEWVPLDPGIVRAAAAALLLVGLTVAVLGAVLGSLPENARMDSLPDEHIPAPCLPLVARIEALGFARLGPALRVHLEPMATIVPLWHAAERSYATVFVSDGAPAQAHFDFVTVFEPGEVALTSAANPGAGVLPPSHGAFLQIFPGAAPETLVEHHREGRDHLAHAAGVQPRPCCADFGELLARALWRQRVAFLRAPLRHTWIALGRTLSKRTPALGPVAAQAATRDRIDALADPLARADAEDVLAVR
jgi:hypothetical protein